MLNLVRAMDKPLGGACRQQAQGTAAASLLPHLISRGLDLDEAGLQGERTAGGVRRHHLGALAQPWNKHRLADLGQPARGFLLAQRGRFLRAAGATAGAGCREQARGKARWHAMCGHSARQAREAGGEGANGSSAQPGSGLQGMHRCCACPMRNHVPPTAAPPKQNRLLVSM